MCSFFFREKPSNLNKPGSHCAYYTRLSVISTEFATEMVAVTEETMYTNSEQIGNSYNWDAIACQFNHFSYNKTGLHCSAHWDNVKCWPPTRAGEIANESCPFWEDYNQSMVRAYRICKENGEWQNKSDYNECLNYTLVAPQHPEGHQTVRILAIVCLTFSCISLLLLLISLFIFYYFKSLKCTRVAIHKNLFFSFALKYTIIILTSQSSVTKDNFDYTQTPSSTSILHIPVVCRMNLILLQYFNMVNIFWMLNEGVYLTSRIAFAVFSTKSNLRMYFAVGWGLPIVYVAIWAGLMWQLKYDDPCWYTYVNSESTKYILLILSVPQFVAFLLNMLILINIIRILVTKLRASHSVETNQVRKAIKATAVLLPLLGVALMLSFWQYPDKNDIVYHFVFSTIISTQGMFVAIIYCFLNSEVQMTVKRKLKRIHVMRKAKGPHRMQASPASFMVATSSEVVLPMSYHKIVNNVCLETKMDV
ncbi:calcitonin gene-related peptide type 1 receptor-like [Anneissia japonica]|uniref:calcitonin gene-related peptide type 1 receptor-like n=1 Tax=Anneissia japonica TaxID=1529436 RepID=UPI00142566A7|nr:calcitonin gene-related peptide type 1 receptor-like [Anneissia japonica]